MPIDVDQDYELPSEEDEKAFKTFKDFAAQDVDSVFFCLDEFADMHNIDGKEMPAVVETDELKDHSSHWEAGAKQNFDTGLYDTVLVLYVKAKDYGAKPKIKKKLILDKDPKMFQVLDVSEESGVYRMQIGRSRL